MYKPTTFLLDGLRNAFPKQLFPWDDYFSRMAETDFLSGRAYVPAVKSFFMRKAPFGGSYALLGGMVAALRGISDVYFDDPSFKAGMLDMGYRPEFVEWLASRGNLRLKVYAPPEGSIIFPNEPIITVTGPLVDVRFAEGIITEAVNFATLSLTKWHRLVRVVRPGTVLEFSRRRAQNSYKASLYAMLAGCSFTSNSEIRRFFSVPVTGTMGHEWMQSFGDIRQAFKTWLDYQPGKPVGLVDTKQCLEHDFPIWLDEVWNHRDAIKAANPSFWGWRNDSGDLAYLTIEQYVRFMKHPLASDGWFRDKMRLVLTNDLDEYSAAAIIRQIRAQAGEAGFPAEDILRRIIWAAGTKPGTCDDQPSLGGVAKLMEADGAACLKLAFDAEGRPGVKTSIPGFNFSAIVRDSAGEAKTILIYPARKYNICQGKLCESSSGNVVSEITARHPDNPNSQLIIPDYHIRGQQQLMWNSIGGDVAMAFAWDSTPYQVGETIAEVTRRAHCGVDSLHWSLTRLEKPHLLKVSLTPDLFDLRQRMIGQGVLREDFLK